MSNPKNIKCTVCQRRVRDNWESKTNHVMKYHPEIPLIRIVTTMFTPVSMEGFGYRFGEFVKRMVS